jgi:predicted metal-binding membrane protein
MSGMSMPAHGWLGAYAAFVVQWVGMMAAMMLPSLLPRLWSYGRAVRGAGLLRAGVLIGAAAMAYLAVWGIVAGVVYPAELGAAAMKENSAVFARLAPMLTGVVMAAAGLAQFTAWKARHLACWRAPVRCGGRYTMGQALRFGVGLGAHCIACGAGLAAVMLVLGVMDPRAMLAATAAVTLERVAPTGERIARGFGGAGLLAGALMVGHALGMV